MAADRHVSAGAQVLVMMGVSGAGKTTIGQGVSRRLGWAFKEGDELHPAANVAKMQAGHPLDDADRAPWLAAIGRFIDAWLTAGQSGVITCSALKRAYRDQIREGRPAVRFVFLQGDMETLEERVAGRHGHFMPASLLASQVADLQPPAGEPNIIAIDIRASVERQVDEIVAAIGGRQTCR